MYELYVHTRHHQRVDYGEGEFPSMWPSELEQDDINGWHERVAPVRSSKRC